MRKKAARAEGTGHRLGAQARAARIRVGLAESISTIPVCRPADLGFGGHGHRELGGEELRVLHFSAGFWDARELANRFFSVSRAFLCKNLLSVMKAAIISHTPVSSMEWLFWARK